MVSLLHLSAVAQNIVLILAGNIPLVGFHDFFSNYWPQCIGKPLQMTNLLPFLAKYMLQLSHNLLIKLHLYGKLEKF
jgi:BarA-like signal transduction histidine kinase